MNEELKPCPFCGRSDSLYSLPQSVTIPVGGGRILNDWAVGCKQCSFSIKRMTYRKDNAIETWNTRPIEDTLTATIAQKDAEIELLQTNRRLLNRDNGKLNAKIARLRGALKDIREYRYWHLTETEDRSKAEANYDAIVNMAKRALEVNDEYNNYKQTG